MPDVDKGDYIFVCTNQAVENIMKTAPSVILYAHNIQSTLPTYLTIHVLYICRTENTATGTTKKLSFAQLRKKYYRDPSIKITDQLGVTIDQAKRLIQSRIQFNELVRKRFNPPL